VSIASSSNNLTWLQRQQQKLRERKEVQMRTERYPQESRLITELRNIQQHSYSRVLRPSASHRADGYTSDTTHFADDDDDQEDFTIPLHINTTTSPTHKLNSVGSAPASPLLPNRTSSRRYYGTATTLSHQSSSQSYPSGIVGLHGRQKSDSAFDKERPFVAVKRAHEQTRKFKEIQVSALCFVVMQGIPYDSSMSSYYCPHVRLRSFAIWPLGVWWMGTDLSEEHVPSIIGVTLRDRWEGGGVGGQIDHGY